MFLNTRGTKYECNENSFEINTKELYQLFEGQERLRIADLGQLILGEKINDTYQLLTDVLVECEQRNLFALNYWWWTRFNRFTISILC